MAIFIINSTLLFIPLKHQASKAPHKFPITSSTTKQKRERHRAQNREKLEEEKEGVTPTTNTMLMTKPPQYSLLIILLLITTTANSSGGDHHGLELGFLIPTAQSSSALSSTCRGTVAECMAMEGEEEFQLDSEINRRILATRRYISYGALRRNYVPCSRRGASYYNCHSNGRANPYRRGCSRITRCRR